MIELEDELVFADRGWEPIVSSTTTDDSHLVLRETPAWVVRERAAQIKLRIQKKKLERELENLHHAENFDHVLAATPAPVVKHNRLAKWLGFNIERFSVMFCHYFHRTPDYTPGDDYTTCVCGNKFAVPWADRSKLPHDVYRQDPFPMPKTKTMQAECKGAHAKLLS